MADNTPFDPDAYLSKSSSSGFDPDAYLSKPVSKPSDKPFEVIPWKEGGLAIASGLSGGLAPALEAAGRDLVKPFQGEVPSAGQPGAFKQDVSDARAKYDIARKAYPGQFTGLEAGSNLAGQVATGSLGATKAVEGLVSSLPEVAQTGASVLGNAGLGALQSATQGGSAAVGAGIGAAPGVAGALVRGASPAVQALKNIGTSPEAQGAAKLFQENPELLQQARAAPLRIPALQQATVKTSGDLERNLQNTLTGEKARLGDMYEGVKAKGLQSGANPVENPSEATSEQFRTKLEGLASDPTMKPFKQDLENAVNHTGIQTEQGVVSPRQTVIDTTQPGSTPTIQYSPFSEGQNMSMSIELKRRLDDMVDKAGTYSDLSVEEKNAVDKLKELRSELNGALKNPQTKDLPTDAQHLYKIADQDYTKYVGARDLLNNQLGSKVGKQTLLNADKIAKVAGTNSPQVEQQVNQALGDIGQQGALEPLKAQQGEVAHLQNLQTQLANVPTGSEIPGVTALNALQKAGKIGTAGLDATTPLVGGTVGERAQQVVRSVQPAVFSNLAGNSRPDQVDTDIKTVFKDNPAAASWVMLVGKTPNKTVPQSAIDAAAKQNNEDPNKIKTALLALGKQVTP